MMKATCMGCNTWTDCHQAHDIGWVCSNCRGNFPPPPHIMRQIEKEFATEKPIKDHKFKAGFFGTCRVCAQEKQDHHRR